MNLTLNGLIDPISVNHTKNSIANQETITFYIDQTNGWETINYYTEVSDKNIKLIEEIRIFKVSTKESELDFIRNIFYKLDRIIDLDFSEMDHNNGSLIDIYHVNYSSLFSENIVGQALAQKTENGEWWDIFWMNKIIEKNNNYNLNTVIHEIGHSLGLSHPFNDPYDESYSSQDTIMSYNKGPSGWDTWFSKTDLNALISIWGRENDDGKLFFLQSSRDYKYKKNTEGKYLIKTDIGYEDISEASTLEFIDKTIEIEEIENIFDSLKLIDHVSCKLYRLYNAAFGRFPDYDGLNYWLEKNTRGEETYRETAALFVESKEFKNLYSTDSNDEKYVTSLYQNTLGRNPDNDGFNYWKNQLSKGFENRHEILMGFSESTEHKTIFSEETTIF